MTAKSELRERQILIAIYNLTNKNKIHKCSIIDILAYNIEHFSKFDWSYLIISREINRLDRKINITIIKKKIDCKVKNKNYKQLRNVKYISLKVIP